MTNHFDKKLMSFATDVAEGKITVAAAPPPKPMTKFEGDVTVPRTPGLGKIQAEQTIQDGEKLDEILGLGGDIAAIYRDWKKWRAKRNARKAAKENPDIPKAPTAPSEPAPRGSSLMDRLGKVPEKRAEAKKEAESAGGKHPNARIAAWAQARAKAGQAMKQHKDPDKAAAAASDHVASAEEEAHHLRRAGYVQKGHTWVKKG